MGNSRTNSAHILDWENYSEFPGPGTRSLREKAPRAIPRGGSVSLIAPGPWELLIVAGLSRSSHNSPTCNRRTGSSLIFW